VAVISRSEISERAFRDWTMGFVLGEGMPHSHRLGFTDVLTGSLASVRARAQDIWELLEEFRGPEGAACVDTGNALAAR